MSTIAAARRNRSSLRAVPGIRGSVADFRRIAEATERGLMVEYLPGGGLRFHPPCEGMQQAPIQGSQHIDPLSDDLLLVRTEWQEADSGRVEFDLRGWLYLHFRLEGLSDEEIAGGARRRLDRECFVLSASPRPTGLVRDMLGDSWRAVGIMCRPAFAQEDLRSLADSLPEELRRFCCGDPVEFAFVGDLTAEMRVAVQSLLHTQMPQEFRNAYLRAKVVELVCLTLARIRSRNEIAPTLPMRLSRRDIDCIHRAREFLLANSPAPVASLSGLARQVGINRNKLAIGFKHLFGVTVGEFDRELRLARAHDLLHSPELPISRVADLAGYADPSSFSKAFRLRYGVLPSELMAPGMRRK